ncbi:shikimate dehydrogenase [Bacillus alkalicellulosilyticus]|uniref:shikimate dehydrogenase n=1 Tax=Alkalihalobacterium alkalicellulosilyticum TaxID=1912214 RepID=UPI0009966F43|nr:shikimate dehydrogenase [Bacillus alkalicellulosilyticus]
MGKLFCLIGNPVGHSLSPHMHNDAFSQLGMNHHYHAFKVEQEDLEAAVAGLKALGVAGFNVTIPHKVEIMKYLDKVDGEAKKIGAVNTVVLEDGQYIGYNTDGQGYLQSLLDITDTLQSKNVLVVGAGGASRAIVTVLSSYGVASLTIANRTIEKAIDLAKQCQDKTEIRTMTIHGAEEQLNHFDLIINTTSVGMSPNINALPLSVEKIKEGTIVSDLIYNPLKTKFLLDGEAKGAIAHDGVGMFVGQGALAFQKWTGILPDRIRMKKLVIAQLEGKTC